MSFVVKQTALPDVLLIEPRIHGDDRGFFFESYNAVDFTRATGVNCEFVQDNHSKSTLGVLRGLHYQIEHAQGKLVRVIEGAIFDVAVDIRIGSPSFGEWVGVELTAKNNRQLWVPPDFAHGFLVVSNEAQVLYKTTDYYAPQHERSIKWNDADLGILWPKIDTDPSLSLKDMNACSIKEAELPHFSK